MITQWLQPWAALTLGKRNRPSAAVAFRGSQCTRVPCCCCRTRKVRVPSTITVLLYNKGLIDVVAVTSLDVEEPPPAGASHGKARHTLTPAFTVSPAIVRIPGHSMAQVRLTFNPTSDR